MVITDITDIITAYMFIYTVYFIRCVFKYKMELNI